MAVSMDWRSRCSKRSSSWTRGGSIPPSSATSRSTSRRRTPRSRRAASSRSAPRAWCGARSWTGFARWFSRTGRSRLGRARSTATAMATSGTRARLARCGPSFEPSSATTSSSRTTANTSTFPYCAGSRPDETAWTASCSTTRCRSFARCRATAASWRTSRCASASTAGAPGAPPVAEVSRRLGGPALRTRLGAEPDPAQRYPAAVPRLRALMDEPSPPPPDRRSPMGRGGTLDESIDRLLERVALSTSDGIEIAPDRVNLLTLHSTKGLEFSRVYIVGVEDYQIPGLREMTEHRQAEIEEARRLLYVGMTRARERLVLTRVERRFGMDAGGSSFVEEMGLEVQGVGAE